MLPQDWRFWAFYLGTPVLFAFYAAANNWRLIEALGIAGAFSFYAAHAVVPWLITGTLTYLVMQACRRWQPPPWAIMMTGSVLACLLTIPYTRWLSSGVPWFGVLLEEATLNDPWRIATYMARATVVWLVVNYFFDRILHYPRYRYPVVPPGATAQPAEARLPLASQPPADARPPFMARMAKPATLKDLLAIKAEQHYIQVVTRLGNEMILCRLSDAVREIPAAVGVQVHRSWWVHRESILSYSTSGKKMFVKLDNGLDVPVSIPHQALVRALFADQHRKLQRPGALVTNDTAA